MFLKQVARAYPGQELHLVMDNYSTRKKAEVRARLERHPRIHVHHTPTSASWMNLVEVWFGIIEKRAIHRGTLRLRQRPQRQDPRPHRRLERSLPLIRVDQDRRRDPQEGQPFDYFNHGALQTPSTDRRSPLPPVTG